MARYDAYTKALLHFTGADAATTFTDEIGKAWTASGDAQIDTAQSKFGGASGLFDGNGDYITTPDHADFDFGNGDFTLDFWVRFAVLPGAGVFSGFYSQRTAYTNNNAMALELYNQSGIYKFSFSYSVDGSTPVSNISDGITISANIWYHFALVRNGANAKIYQNGTLIHTYNVSSNTIYNSTDVVSIGGVKENTFQAFLNGHLDEFRISKGIARWTANFTPPTKPYGSGGLFTFHG